MSILAIDPGPQQSAYVEWENNQIRESGIVSNSELLTHIEGYAEVCSDPVLVIEGMQSYGSIIGKSTIDTLIWVGRFVEAWHQLTTKEPALITRPTIKAHICGNAKANDSNVREALMDRIGPQGMKRAPGPTYGIKTHLWAALALAIYAHDTRQERAA